MTIVSIIIVNYCTAKLTVECIRSLERERQLSNLFEVVLIDNASPDQSAQELSEAIKENGWESWVHLTAAPRNGGFAYGNNIGIRFAPSRNPEVKYFLLLNPDTIVRPGAIELLVGFMEANQKVGIAGSRLEDQQGNTHISAFRFHSMLSELDRGLNLGFVSNAIGVYRVAPPAQLSPHRTDWVSGASFMVRREVFEDIGLLDEGYFMYYEEVDFCLRAHRAGWECWYVPHSRVVHLIGQASGIQPADSKPARRPAYVYKSRSRFFQRSYGRLYAILADQIYLVTYPLWRVRRWLQRKPDRDPAFQWWDTFVHSSIFHVVDRSDFRH
jgi:N-acetylglucosaminyl-diphospho-decaprenol L-rhamnosyltransferase